MEQLGFHNIKKLRVKSKLIYVYVVLGNDFYLSIFQVSNTETCLFYDFINRFLILVT